MPYAQINNWLAANEVCHAFNYETDDSQLIVCVRSYSDLWKIATVINMSQSALSKLGSFGLIHCSLSMYCKVHTTEI